MKKLKLAAIGAGNVFKWAHLPAIKEHPEIEIAAVCDFDVDKAKELADSLGVKDVYQHYEEVLRRDDIDIVTVCTPNLYHSQVSVAALDAGKHVFCEKPDAVNPAEAQKMADAAAKSGRVLMSVRNNRFRPAAQFLKRYAAAGHMGEIYTGRCGWIRRRGIPGRGGWFTTKELSGGGPLIDLGVHMIDLAIWLMGNPKPVSVTGAAYDYFAGNGSGDPQPGIFDVEDLATGFIRFDNGATLQIEFSWAANIGEEMNFVELRGSKAGCSLKNGDLKLFTEIEGTLCDIVPKLPGDSSGHSTQFAHFVDVVMKRSEPIMTPEQGVDMIKILSALYESAETGREVLLS